MENNIEKNKNVKTKHGKNRIILVMLFLLIFGGISYVTLRGTYLEYLELGEKYISIFYTNIKYKYSIMIINFLLLYLIIYYTNKGIKKRIKSFF